MTASPLRISVITCTKNSERYVAQTLASVAAQTHPDVEQIFVDGGSTDGTLELLRRQPGRTRIIERVSAGISHAMNVGIDASSGDVIAHLHSDDYYLHPGVLATVATTMQGTGCDWLFGRIVSDVDGRQVGEAFTAPRFSPRRLLRRNFVPHPAAFVRKEVFRRFGLFREDYRLAMDYEFWLRIAPHCSVCQLDEPLAAFRVHSGSASVQHWRESLREDFRARFNHAPWWMWPEMGARYAARRWLRRSEARACASR